MSFHSILMNGIPQFEQKVKLWFQVYLLAGQPSCYCKEVCGPFWAKLFSFHFSFGARVAYDN